MPAPIDTTSASNRPLRSMNVAAARERGVEPLRRKHVQTASSSSSRRRRVVNALLAFAAVVLLADALVGDKGLMERMRARKQLQEAEAAVAAIRLQNAQMRDYSRRLREDPSLIEGLAREELGLIRPGELLFILRNARPPGN